MSVRKIKVLKDDLLESGLLDGEEVTLCIGHDHLGSLDYVIRRDYQEPQAFDPFKANIRAGVTLLHITHFDGVSADDTEDLSRDEAYEVMTDHLDEFNQSVNSWVYDKEKEEEYKIVLVDSL